jgi:hypothetical protein
MTDDRWKVSGVGCQKTGDRGQRSEVGGQRINKSEVGMRKSEFFDFGIWNLNVIVTGIEEDFEVNPER